MLPVYMRQRVTSAYELLELRLGIVVRLLGACMFVTLRLVWMSMLIFLAATAMSVMMGIDFKWPLRAFDREWLTITELELIVLATGLVAVIYTSLGGLKAVVITDTMQTALLFGGALLVISPSPTTFRDSAGSQNYLAAELGYATYLSQQPFHARDLRGLLHDDDRLVCLHIGWRPGFRTALHVGEGRKCCPTSTGHAAMCGCHCQSDVGDGRLRPAQLLPGAQR